MKVIVCSSAYPNNYEDFNGIFVHDQAMALKRRGIDVEVVAPIPLSPFPFNRLNEKWKSLAKMPGEEVRGGLKVRRPRYLSLPRNLTLSRTGDFMCGPLLATINKHYKTFDFDIIHAHYAYPMGYAVADIAMKLSVPLVISTHGLDTAFMVNSSRAVRDKTLLAFKGAGKVLAVSQKLKHDLVSLGISEDKISVVGNGVMIPSGIDASDIKNTYKNARILLSVSNLIASKGIDINLAAFKNLLEKHDDFIYIIIGDGKERKNLEFLASRLGIGKRVLFLGPLPHAEVLRYISACDIFSLPSWSEGFGIVYLEAMSLGKPVIACKGEGIDGVIIDGQNGFLVEPKSIESLSEILDDLALNTGKARSIGGSARDSVVDEYTWDRVAEKIDFIYRGMVGE